MQRKVAVPSTPSPKRAERNRKLLLKAGCPCPLAWLVADPQKPSLSPPPLAIRKTRAMGSLKGPWGPFQVLLQGALWHQERSQRAATGLIIQRTNPPRLQPFSPQMSLTCILTKTWRQEPANSHPQHFRIVYAPFNFGTKGMVLLCSVNITSVSFPLSLLFLLPFP